MDTSTTAEYLTQPCLDPELGVLWPDDAYEFWFEIRIGNRTIPVHLNHIEFLLDEAILYARRIAASLPRLVTEIQTVVARKLHGDNWVEENLETPFCQGSVLSILESTLTGIEVDMDYGLELWCGNGLYTNHGVRLEMRDDQVEVAF